MKRYTSIALRIIVAIILLQTLRFKFTAHPDSVYIFSKAGLEPYGRILIGILELISSILLLRNKTAWIGAILTSGIIGGAIFLHLTKIGIQVNNDNGVLFITAIITFILSIIIIYIHRKDIPSLSKFL
ncbi:DoxX family membrane protein [Corallibacter sp.]|uniref:DoxX family membrane protein n=1 Tax=Corallibacter sp. TaxID=2038084 RepID=UPI003A905793